MAFFLPFEAVYSFEVTAMPGEWPAIVQSPHNRTSEILKIIEEYFNIEVISVKIMKVNYARL
jgi:hypothetical protein